MPPSQNNNPTKGKEQDMEEIQLGKEDDKQDMAVKEEASTKNDQAAKEESTTTTNSNSSNTNPEEEYRQRCRRFYRQSTSVISDGDSENDEESSTKIPPPADNRIVLEAVDKLSEQSTEGYASFLSTLSPEQLVVLQQCGLPIDASDNLTLTSNNLGHFIQIRTEERQLAHQVTMQERLTKLQRILKEIVQEKEQNTNHDNSNTTTSSTEILTTRQQVLFLQSTLRQFVSNYFESLAAHSLLAGMRQCLERQLDHDEVCVCWTFNAAVISEAVVAQQEGTSAQYMKDALQALLSFMVIYNNNENGDTSTNINNNMLRKSTEDPSVSQLTLAMDPTLSDRTLHRLLQILPRVDELQARPTGQFDTTPPTSAGAWRRTNVEGTLDQPMDLCTAMMHHLKIAPGWWWFC